MTVFNMIVYTFSIFLMFINDNKQLKIVGMLIFISHLYKDIKNMKVWPLWSEFAGILLAYIIFKEGIKTK